MWSDDLRDVRRRIKVLDLERELADARARVVRWRHVEPFSTFFLPLPLVAQAVPSVCGAWLDNEEDDDDRERSELVGLDAVDRPVVHLLEPGGPYERPKYLWWWAADGSFVEVELMGSGPHVRCARCVDGRVTSITTASQGVDELEVQLVTWDGDTAIRVDAATCSSWHRGRAQARTLVDAAGGSARCILTAGEPWQPAGDEPLAPREAPALHRELHRALEGAAALVPAELAWDGRVEETEQWLGDAAAQALVEPLAAALAAALRAAAHDSGVHEPFVLDVRLGAEDPVLPPFATLGGRSFRDAMRASSRQDRAAVHELWRAVDSGGAAELRLVEYLDAEALRACRVLSTALSTGAPWESNRQAAVVADALGDRLATLLSAPLPGAAEAFLALVDIGDPYGEGMDDGPRALRRAKRTAGAPAVERFLQSVASVAVRPPPELAGRALADRDALEELLRYAGLARDARRLAHDVAAWGVRLEPAGAGATVGSRLGGPALLPAGTAWPTTRAGRPLSFLAALDFGELRPDERFPAAGWALGFASLGDEDDEGLVGEADNREGSVARLLWVPAGSSPVAARTPGALAAGDQLVLGERRVTGRRVLTLPDGYDAGEQLGLDVPAAQAYEEVVERLAVALVPGAAGHENTFDPEPADELGDAWVADDDWDDEEKDWDDDEAGPWVGGIGHHWVGGHVTGAQGHPPEEGTLLLLHLGWDTALGFEYLDGGVVQFRIGEAALVASDRTRVVASADSG